MSLGAFGRPGPRLNLARFNRGANGALLFPSACFLCCVACLRLKPQSQNWCCVDTLTLCNARGAVSSSEASSRGFRSRRSRNAESARCRPRRVPQRSPCEGIERFTLVGDALRAASSHAAPPGELRDVSFFSLSHGRVSGVFRTFCGLRSST